MLTLPARQKWVLIKTMPNSVVAGAFCRWIKEHHNIQCWINDIEPCDVMSVWSIGSKKVEILGIQAIAFNAGFNAGRE